MKKVMKKLKMGNLCRLAAVAVLLCACAPDGHETSGNGGEGSSGDGATEVVPAVHLNENYTFNGVNVKYKMKVSLLKVGDEFVLELDSENDIKPKVAIFWDGEEVATIDELPCLFEKTLDRPGTFDLRLKVSSLDVEFTRKHMIEVTE